MRRHLILVIAVLFVLASCGTPPTATPDVVATQVAQSRAVAATLTAAAPTATATFTPSPTATTTHTPTATPTSTPSPTPTPSPTVTPTRTPHPTSTPRPTSTSTSKPTQKPADPEVVAYLREFAPIADEIWANFPGDLSAPAQAFVDRLEPLYEELDAMSVPEPAERMHLAFGLVAISVIQWHHYRAGADLFPGQFNEYMDSADAAGDEALAWYFNEYLPARDALLRNLGLSPEDVGFEESEDGTPATTPKPTKAPTATPAMQLLADSQADFTGSQGQNSWEVLFSEGRNSFNWKQMDFDGTCYRAPFTDEDVRICPDHGAAGAGGDIAWLYKAETSGQLVFKVTAHKVEAQGDDVEIKIYRHTNELKEWDLYEGDTQGFTRQFELDVNGGEMFFFTIQVSSTWREFKYDPNVFRVQVYVKE